MKKEVLIIDCQVFQSTSFFRGMGRYSRKLLEYILIHEYFKDFEIEFIFNKYLSLTLEKSEYLHKLRDDIKFTYLDLPVIEYDNTKKYIGLYEEILNNYIQKSYSDYIDQKINFLILSNFENGTSLAAFPSLNNVVKHILWYDLIPYLFSNIYMEKSEQDRMDYYARFINLYNADKIYSISKTSMLDLTSSQFNIRKDRIINIDGALIDNDIEIKDSDLKQFDQDFSKYSSFILCPSGDEYRKNNKRTVEAFAKFSIDNNNKYSLLFTSKFSEVEKGILNRIKDSINKDCKIFFLGNVSDQMLKILYTKAEFIFFIPLYEGLGLPILEAIKYNKKIVASRIPVILEILNNGFFFTDPYKIDEIVNALNSALVTELSEEILEKYKAINEKYTWENTSIKFITEFKKTSDEFTINKEKKKLKIAIAGPDLNSYSTIAKYIEEVFSILYPSCDIDYYFDLGLNTKTFRYSFLPYLIESKHISELTRAEYKKYDAVLYNIGNSEFHVEIYKRSLVLPGINIMHELSLNGLYGFSNQNHLIEDERIHLEKDLEVDPKREDNFLINSLVNSSLGIITHSEYARSKIFERLIFDIGLQKLNLPITYNEVNKDFSSKINIGIAGIIVEHKGIRFFEEIIPKLTNYLDQVNFIIFGYDNLIDKSRLTKLKDLNCTFKHNLTDFEFENELRNLHILLNFRTVYNGETSKTTCDGFKNGVVSIVRNIGWFSEIPDEVAIKLDNQNEITDKLIYLIENRDKLKQYSDNSISYSQKIATSDEFLNGMLSLIKEAEKKTNPNKVISDKLKSYDDNISDKLLGEVFKV